MGWLLAMLVKSRPIKAFETIEKTLSALKELESVVLFCVSELRDIQSSKLGKTHTEKELEEFKRMRGVIDALFSILRD